MDNSMSPDPFAKLTLAETGAQIPSAIVPNKKTVWAFINPIPQSAGNPPYDFRGLGPAIAQWLYHNEDGTPAFWMSCCDKADGSKEFRPSTYCQAASGERQWRLQGMPEPRLLYNLHILAANPDKPVLVCEGEKSAEAAALLFPEYVAITSPNGSKCASKADWSAMLGRNVVIWPDHDGAGMDYANDVARFATEAGAASVAIVKVPDHVDDGWDLADTPPEGYGVVELRALLERAVPFAPAAQRAASPVVMEPSGYRMTKKGLFFDDGKPENSPCFISEPFEVLGETRDDGSNAWGKLLRWPDGDGVSHEWPMPVSLLAGDGVEVIRRLLDGGLVVSPGVPARRKLIEYLSGVRVPNRVRCVNSAGWHKNVYVTPDNVYGNTGGETVVLQTTAPIKINPCLGTLQEWKDLVAAYAVGNSRLALCISTAFAGPILRLAGEDSFGVHLKGGSSTGKSTAARCAGSVCAAPLDTWRTTDNAAEGRARRANDGLLLLDELSQGDGRAADAMVYMLGNGQGKGRMNQDTSLRSALEWRLVFVSTGEVGIADKIGEVGKTARAGQSVRMIEIPADTGSGHRVFETLHGFANGDGLACHLRDAADHQRGHAIRSFLERLTADVPAATKSIKAMRSEWLKSHLPVGADGQVSRVATRFGLIAAAGQLASDYGLLPWPDGEAEHAAAVCFAAWLAQRGGVGAAENAAGLARVRAFIEAHGASRFTGIDEYSKPDGLTTINRAGFKRKDSTGRWKYLVFPEAWKKEVCKGLDASAVSRDLITRGLLLPDHDGKSARSENLPGLGKKRMYVLSPDILA